jgi:hypothetical protein
MLEIIGKYYIEFGQPPTAKYFMKSGIYHNNPTANTYIKRFGSWNNAVQLAIDLALQKESEEHKTSALLQPDKK